MLWARLYDGQRAHDMLTGLIDYNMLDNLFTTHHIPLQIDGNYGIAAAIVEMLVQSHNGVVQLLPAACAQWPEGSVKGLKARGNVEVSMSWKDGRSASFRRCTGERSAYTGGAGQVGNIVSCEFCLSGHEARGRNICHLRIVRLKFQFQGEACTGRVAGF